MADQHPSAYDLAPAALSLSGEAGLGDQVWIDVLSAMDRTYADLVEHQEQLERQHAELTRLHGFLASVFASVSDIIIVASRGGLVEEASASLEALLAPLGGAVAGRAVTSLFAAADRADLQAAMALAGQMRRPVTIEARIETGGGEAPLELSLSPRLDDRGRVAGMVLTGRPLGELRQAYAALARSHAELQVAQAGLVRNEKLASLGRLLAGVAHELNNPISFVYANAHALERYVTKFETYFEQVSAGASREDLVLLREQLRLDREVKNLRLAVAGASSGAARVRDIVEDLRRLSSDGTGEMVDLDLVETARVAASWVVRGLKQGVTLRFTGAPLLMVRARAGHIQQVVMNLMQNALNALDGVDAPELRLSFGVLEGRGVIEVADNGPGVPEALAQAIFDPFFTTKPVGRGTGLGLSISHKIAQEHGGALRLCRGCAALPLPDLAEGPLKGACFRLDLPLAEGAL